MPFDGFELDLAVLKSFLTVAIIIYLGLWYRSYRRLKHIPGPRGWGWTIVPWARLHTTPGIFEKYHDLIVKHGPLVRVGPNTLITADAELARRVGATRSSYLRSAFYMCMRLNPGEDHIFSLLDERRHQELRRKMGAGYSGKDNETLEQDIDDCILDLVRLIERKYLSAGGDIKPMDLAQKAIYLTSDVISKIAFNAKLYNVRDDTDHHGYIKNNEELFPNLIWTATVPSLVSFLTKTRVLHVLTRLMESQAVGLVTVRKLVYKQVSKRFRDSDAGEKEVNADMLGSFLRHGLTEEEAQRESMLNLTAGTDTTATPIRATLLGILSNPRIYRSVVAEIDEAMDMDRIPSDPNKVVSEQAARELPYMQACIKEVASQIFSSVLIIDQVQGLRWFPPVIGEFSKKTPPEGDTICGYQVPGNVKIGLSQKSLHRTPDLYGPDADSFRPERWLPTTHPLGHESSSEKLRAMERNNELVFGAGRFQCLGRPVALMELSKVFVELLRRFDMEVMNPLEPLHSESWGVFFQRDFWVVVRRRER